MHSRYQRLSLADRSNLRIERPETPAHVGGLCIVEAGPLLDSRGELDMVAIKRRLERRLARVPELRRVVHRPPPLCGPPLWVDDPAFSVDRHLRTVAVPAPGDEDALLATTEQLMRPLLDRSHPLWQLWFLTGLARDRLGLLFKVHHAVADGLAAVALMASLFDLEPEVADPAAQGWEPALPPANWALLQDILRGRAASVRSALSNPLRLARGAGSAFADSVGFFRSWSRAPLTSLNTRPGAARRLRVAHLDLEAARAVAHAHGAKVNDVVLAVVTGGVRELLVSRGGPVQGLELKVSVPATLRTSAAARQLGNAAGALLVELPAGEADPARRLELIAASSAAAKAEQHPAYVQSLFGWLAAAGLARPLARHQRMVNFFVTNVPGPAVPFYVLGARIEEVMPIIGLAGNISLMFAAFSYCGRLDLIVNANAAACPDVDVLAEGMRRAWQELAELSATAGDTC